MKTFQVYLKDKKLPALIDADKIEATPKAVYLKTKVREPNTVALCEMAEFRNGL